MNKFGAATVLSGVPIAIAIARNLELLGRDYGVLHPVSAHVVLPYYFGVPAFVSLAGWLLAYYAWNPGLFTGAATPPARTLWMWRIVGILSLANYAFGWHYGMRYQGQHSMQAWLALGMLLCAASGFMLFTARRTPSFWRALGGHATLWLWLMTVAVPWLGESP